MSWEWPAGVFVVLFSQQWRLPDLGCLSVKLLMLRGENASVTPVLRVAVNVLCSLAVIPTA